MAIYRPPKARWPLALGVGVMCLAVGLVAGLVLGGGDGDPKTAASEIRSALISAAGSLEVAAVEYEESVEDGEVTRRPEYDGALAALDSSMSRYEEVAPALEALAPERADGIESGFDDCEALMRDLAEASEVTECLQALDEILSG